METIPIKAGDDVYPVYIGYSVTNHLRSFLETEFPNRTSILIITDETVGSLYLEKLIDAVSEQNLHVKIVPAGEKAKTFEVYYDCLSFALEKKLDRKSLILSFGGGAVGDLAGFVAASFMRGIPFIQIPTTILAHDSAVGGKVAINHPLGKNMIGAFYQPKAVFYDLSYLVSLSNSEVRSGFAEVIKHALISDEEFYQWILGEIKSLDNITPSQLINLLTSGIRVKAGIVEQDEKESGVRAYLNFGHTLGHAIEAEMGYGSITHGEAVTIGMIFALQLSSNVNGLKLPRYEFVQWLTQLGYKTELPEGLSIERLLGRMKQDKKSYGEKVRFVLLENLGQPTVQEISDELILENLAVFKNRRATSD
ncbi:3-dehydroquinate synthase [Mesobacillus maritimus]|uniref:3-dehydroquinate synthase n=1 Tax=Mesobacillus maritimus TaxID=1643336 RepID=UPI00203BD2B5|nr:3-dehydroquinate synthase [Mesobacillus maritimus]MCM3669463.1 3-dehydroquinate synthase [Mesobacillus maritimus]